MAETSFPWDGDSSVGGTGDCGPYSADEYRDWYRLMFCSSVTTEAVVPIYANKLEVTSTANESVSIATGAALLNGIWYENTSAATKTCAAVDNQTTYYRIVLQGDWTTQTVRLATIGGTSTAPAVTQTDGTTYEISLALVTVASTGDTTVTDERTYLHFNTMLDGDNIDTGAITAANIANRTRQFNVQPMTMWNSTDSASVVTSFDGAYLMPDGKNQNVYGTALVPSDYSSGMTAYALVETTASANVVDATTVWSAATGGTETAATAAHSTGSLTEALATSKLTKCASVSVASAAANDLLTLKYTRYGASTADTLSASLYFYGWLLSYTADS